jgi:D-threo-aldose 1-dehydrogenase
VSGSLRQRRITATGTYLTEVGLGTAPLGNLYSSVTDGEAHEAIDAAWAAGIRFFDTAPHYGLGLAERRLGAALAARPRAEYVVCTKVGRLLRANPRPTGSDLSTGGFAVSDDLTRVLDYSADGVKRSLDESLTRLGLDRVDIVVVHDPDDFEQQAVEETLPALLRLRDEGVITAVGVGMNQWQAPLRMIRAVDIDVVMVAGRWTLLDRSAAPLLEECAARGVSVLAAAPYNSGLLAREKPDEHAHFDYGAVPRPMLHRARDAARLAQQHGLTLPQLAIQFPLRHPAVAAVVAGCASAQEVHDAVSRLTAHVDDADWAAIEEWSGPLPIGL